MDDDTYGDSEEIAARERARKAEVKARIDRYATWTPGLRIDGSRLLIVTGDVELQVGVVTMGVLSGNA